MVHIDGLVSGSMNSQLRSSALETPLIANISAANAAHAAKPDPCLVQPVRSTSIVPVVPNARSRRYGYLCQSRSNLSGKGLR
jgi:hypothetical protein